MRSTKIEWTESTWNPVAGCTKISLGCKNCHAEKMAKRLYAMGQKNYKNGFKVAMCPHVLDYPLKWKKSRLIFVNSMSDLFHEEVPVEFIRKIFNVMNKLYWHTFQILTKRAERLSMLANELIWSQNIWMEVSVESSSYRHRIDCLRKVNASIKFLSIEPLLEPIGKLNLKEINWVIVGGESGTGARPVESDWISEVRDQCVAQKELNGKAVSFFFKQWGRINKKKNGKTLDGKIWDEIPFVA